MRVIRWDYIKGVRAKIMGMSNLRASVSGPVVAILPRASEITEVDIDYPAAHGIMIELNWLIFKMRG